MSAGNHTEERSNLHPLSRAWEYQGEYYSQTRLDLIGEVKGKDLKILDIGCGAGETGDRLLKSGIAAEVVGVELEKTVAAVAETKLSRVFCLNIEDCARDFFGPDFDVILCGDVLEHTQFPVDVLTTLKGWLRPEGRIVVSIPNVRFVPVVDSLVRRGRWTYERDGVMDRGHLRFFTRRSAEEMLKSSSLRIESVRPVYCGRRWSYIGFLLGRWGWEWTAQRFIMVGAKPCSDS